MKELQEIFCRGLKKFFTGVKECVLALLGIVLFVVIFFGPIVLGTLGSAWWLALYLVHAFFMIMFMGLDDD